MVNQIPEHIDPFRFANQGEKLAGNLRVAKLERLVSSLFDDSGEIVFELNFARQDRARIATGQYATGLKMTCQRCLKSVGVEVKGDIQLEFVIGAETEGRLEDQGFETVIFEGTLSLYELIEDEILLALPFSPLHNDEDCQGGKIIEKLQESSRPNPFAVLAQLKDQE